MYHCRSGAKKEGVSLNLFVVEAAAAAAGRYERPSTIATRHRKPVRPARRDEKAPIRGKRAKRMA